MKLFENRKDFPYLRWGEGFFLGLMFAATAAIAMPHKEPEVKYIKVPEIKVIEKTVVQKVPVKLSQNDQTQIECMATNGYFEALGQPKKGIQAVHNVVMNRVEDKRFPKTPCGVINQKARGVCQFSWKCEGHKRITDWAAYKKIKQLAADVYLGNKGDITGGAQFYHADYVRPQWARVFDRTTKIGAHIFYEG